MIKVTNEELLSLQEPDSRLPDGVCAVSLKADRGRNSRPTTHSMLIGGITLLSILSALPTCCLPVLAGTPPYEKFLEKGQHQVKKRAYEDAIASFTAALKDRGDLYQAYLERASAREHINDIDGAVSDFSQVLKINPNVLEAYLGRARLRARLGNKDAAINDFSQVLRLDPKNTAALAGRADVLKQNGAWQRAVDDYSALLKRDKRLLEARQSRAECYKRLHNFQAAIADYQYLFKKQGQTVFPLHLELGEVLMLEGQKEEAESEFKQLISYYSKRLQRTRKNGLDYVRRGIALQQLGEHERALSDLEAAVSLLPADAQARYELAHARLAGGDYKGAIKDLDQALKINSKLSEALLDRAAAEMSEGDNRAALQDLDEALKQEKTPDAYVDRAMAELAQGNLDAAMDDLSTGKSLNPDALKLLRSQISKELKSKNDGAAGAKRSAALMKLGLLDLSDGQLPEAEQGLRKAIALSEKSSDKTNPEMGFCLLALGRVKMEQRSFAQAEAFFRGAIDALQKSSKPDTQKYAIFSLEDCAKAFLNSSNYEKAGSILSYARMVRSSQGIKERSLTGDLANQADRAIDSYKQKKKYQMEEELARKVAELKNAPPKAERQEDQAAEKPVIINKPIRDKWAIIVGISKFHDHKIDLKYAAKDARDFYDFLIKEKNFAPDHVQLLTNETATRANILSILGSRWLPRIAEPDDLVVIYFSSHGSPSSLDVGGVNYLIAYDTDPSDLYATGIAMQDLSRIIKDRVHSDRIMLLLDACHSGSAAPSGKGLVRVANLDVEKIVQGTGQLVISSSKPDQRSWESERYPGSVFTRYLIEGLRRNGEMTRLGAAFTYLETAVQREVLRDRGVLQTPVMKSRWEGQDLIIGAPPANPSPGLGEVVSPAKSADEENNNKSNKTKSQDKSEAANAVKPHQVSGN